MRTMSGGPCLHYDCSNRNGFGYCKTTVCINEHYQQEQWSSTSNRSENVVVKPKTNADRIRAMTDEELEHFINNCIHGALWKMQIGLPFTTSEERLNWLKQEVDDDTEISKK